MISVKTALSFIVLFTCAGLAYAAGKNAPPAESSSRPAAAGKTGWPDIDLKAGRISFKAQVVESSYGLEFLLCSAGGKEYESLLSTEIIPSRLHAALLMLGLYPGIPAHYGAMDRYVPPRGAALNITIEWEDTKGHTNRVRAEEWLSLSEGIESKRKPDTWIFLGSDVMPDGTYVADQTGGIIAVANLPTAVIDVPFESTRDLRARRFVVNRDKIPAAGTSVSVIIEPVENAAKAPYARAILDIDRFGRLFIDGREQSWDDLSAWAGTYTDSHREGMVVIRSLPLALTCYGPRAKLELKLGGVYNFRDVALDNGEDIFPRTDRQLRIIIGKWNKRFEHPEDQLLDPGVRADEELKRVRKRLDDLAAYTGILEKYRQFLDNNITAEQKKSEKEAEEQ